MAPTDPADGPICAAVERWLSAAVRATVAVPPALVTGSGRCVVRQVRAARALIVQPARIVTSLLAVAGRALSSAAAPAASAEVDPPTSSRRRPVDVLVAAESVDAAALPIDEYESLAASQVVARLPALTAGELDVVRHFEAGHRGRRAVLGKIDQLLAAT